MIRLVLDTNVVVSGLLWNGSPRMLLETCGVGRVLAFTSIALLLELEETLVKPKFAKKIAASGFSPALLIDRYSKVMRVIRPTTVPRLAPDPDDDVVIGTAIAARAGFLVTGDLGLLSVLSYAGGRIVRVADALEAIAVH